MKIYYLSLLTAVSLALSTGCKKSSSSSKFSSHGELKKSSYDYPKEDDRLVRKKVEQEGLEESERDVDDLECVVDNLDITVVRPEAFISGSFDIFVTRTYSDERLSIRGPSGTEFAEMDFSVDNATAGDYIISGKLIWSLRHPDIKNHPIIQDSIDKVRIVQHIWMIHIRLYCNGG